MIFFLAIVLCFGSCDICSSHIVTDCVSCVKNSGCGYFASTEEYPAKPLSFQCVEGDEFSPKDRTLAKSYVYYNEYCPSLGPEPAIHKRRSIRKYDTVQLSRAVIEEIIGDAVWAPNCMDVEPLKWYVVQEENLLKNISDSAHAGFDIFYAAPTVIFVFTHASEECTPFEDVDGGLAVLSLELSAYNLGLGTCTIGYSRLAETMIRSVVGASPDEHYVIAVTIGHPMVWPTHGRNPPSIKFVMAMNRYYSDQGIDISYYEEFGFHGDFVNLPHGRTRFILEGEKENRKPLVVFVNGISTSLEMFDVLSRELVERGHRTLRYDSYGRGFSSCHKDEKNSREFFVQQIADLLKILGLDDEEVVLIGGSLGGKIVLDYTSEHPENVRYIVGIAPAGFVELPSVCDVLFRIPNIFTDLLLGVFGKSIFFRNRKNVDEKTAGKLSFFFDNHRATFRCIFSTLKYYLSSTDDFELKTLKKLRTLENVKVLLIAGGKDTEVKIEDVERIQKEIPGSEIQVFENENHFLMFTQPEKHVNPAVIKFLEENL